MKLYRAGSIQLRNNPDTKNIAKEDEERYNRFLKLYVKAPKVLDGPSVLQEPVFESSNRH
jgi:hypothetical protein